MTPAPSPGHNDDVRYVELGAGALGLLLAAPPLLGELRFSLATLATGPPAAIIRLFLLFLLGGPWLAALAGLALGLREDKGSAPLLAGVGGLTFALLGPVRAGLWPSYLLLAAASVLRLRRSPLHPMGVLGAFSVGLFLPALCYIALILLRVGMPRA